MICRTGPKTGVGGWDVIWWLEGKQTGLFIQSVNCWSWGKSLYEWDHMWQGDLTGDLAPELLLLLLLPDSAWERAGPFLASAEWRRITRAPSTFSWNKNTFWLLAEAEQLFSPNSGNKCCLLRIGELNVFQQVVSWLWSWAALSPSPSFCDSQRHSAGVASLKKKALVHQMESHWVRLNLFPLKITIYQDNLPSLPQHTHKTHRHTS